MHESTVSRVCSGKYVQTPRGVFELKFFFSSGLETEDGEDVSARSAKDIIRTLIEEEDKKEPLSDQRIAEMLHEKGLRIARRTVAEYREQLNILRPELTAMSRRLQREPLEVVLDSLASDLDHPLGDLVVTALRLTSTAGGRQAREVLSSLSAAAYSEAEGLRRVEVARERPRTAMKYTAIVIVGFVVLLGVFSRAYLEPYGSVLGQLVLCFVGVYWGLGFWWMRRMGRPEPVDRFLATDREFTYPDGGISRGATR